MTNPLKIALLSATLAALLLPAAAQTSPAPQTGATPPASTPQTTAPSATPHPETINQHRVNQQDRIAAGVDSGRLTSGEASTLEKQESNINHEETDMKKLDNGKLTSADRAALRQQQKQVSNEIHQDKLNGAKQNESPTTQYGKRAENQQDRIAKGMNSGQLTAGESANLESKESSIQKEVAADRKANGGQMTAQEKAQVNHQQNKLSKQIYKDKHNSSKR